MVSRGKSCLLHLLMHDPLHAKQMSLSLMELIPMHDKDICFTSDKYAEKPAVRLSFFMVSDLDQSLFSQIIHPAFVFTNEFLR